MILVLVEESEDPQNYYNSSWGKHDNNKQQIFMEIHPVVVEKSRKKENKCQPHGVIKISRFHPLWTMSVQTNLNSNSFNSCWDISFGLKWWSGRLTDHHCCLRSHIASMAKNNRHYYKEKHPIFHSLSDTELQKDTQNKRGARVHCCVSLFPLSSL